MPNNVVVLCAYKCGDWEECCSSSHIILFSTDGETPCPMETSPQKKTQCYHTAPGLYFWNVLSEEELRGGVRMREREGVKESKQRRTQCWSGILSRSASERPTVEVFHRVTGHMEGDLISLTCARVLPHNLLMDSSAETFWKDSGEFFQFSNFECSSDK